MSSIRPVWVALAVLWASLGLPAGLRAGAGTGPQLAPPPRQTVAPANRMDINTATAAELKALPGMGDAYVRRIIAGRPYTAKNQLVTRGVLPEAAYAGIEALIVAHHPGVRPK